MTFYSTLAGKRFQQMQQKLELLQDELFKIETGKFIQFLNE